MTKFGTTIVGVLLLLFCATESQAVSLGVTSAPLNVVVGETFSVDLAVSGLGDEMSLGGFHLDLLFDPSLLSFRNVVFGDPLFGDQLAAEDLMPVTFTTVESGIVKLTELSLEDPVILDLMQIDSFVLARLSFLALGPGTTGLQISDELLTDASGHSLDTDIHAAVINVSAQPVPEPSSCLLVVTGFAGLAGVRRQRKRKTN